MVAFAVVVFIIFVVVVNRIWKCRPGANFHLSVGVMIKEKIKRANQILMDFSNYFLCSIIYGFGVPISFVLWKISLIRKKKPSSTYWVIPEKEEENYERQ